MAHSVNFESQYPALLFDLIWLVVGLIVGRHAGTRVVREEAGLRTMRKGLREMGRERTAGNPWDGTAGGLGYAARLEGTLRAEVMVRT